MYRNIYNFVEIVDVTLRDGGYLTDFNFKRSLVKEHLKLCDKTAVDYIEVGYRNGTSKPVTNIGESGLSSNRYLDFCRNISKSKLLVMVHPKNIDKNDLRDIKAAGVNGIRIVFSKTDPDMSFKVIEESLKNNLDTFVNIIRISEYSSLEDLKDIVLRLAKYPLKAIYIADSNGHLHPRTTENYIKQLLSLVPNLECGFHAHDHLSLAHANVLSAIEAGAKYIDSSVLGLGRAKGNAKTEDLVPFVNMMTEGRYDMRAVIELYKLWLSQEVTTELLVSDKSTSIISGMKNLNSSASMPATL